MANITVSNNITFEGEGNLIKLAVDPLDNIINISGEDYLLKYLDSASGGGKGGNSNVFILRDPEENELYRGEDLIIKICKYSRNKHHSVFARRRKFRFYREIIAMEKAKQKNLIHTMNYFTRGDIEIGEYVFPFYTMEKADSDLCDHMLNGPYSLQQKLVLCNEILKGITELRNINLYHRDIKHDNIFLKKGQCKIGDLGLHKFMNEDVDAKGEKIGSFGWESPEAVNKSLTEYNGGEFEFDCEIDFQSDVFQLGKLFWYIFQGNLPIGMVVKEDFKIEDEKVFLLIADMIKHSKENRISLQNLNTRLNPIMKKHAVI